MLLMAPNRGRVKGRRSGGVTFGRKTDISQLLIAERPDVGRPAKMLGLSRLCRSLAHMMLPGFFWAIPLQAKQSSTASDRGTDGIR
jgi:hypothetical protein